MIAAIKQDVNKDKLLQAEQVLVIHNLYKSFGNNHVMVDFNLELIKGEKCGSVGKIRIR